MMVSEMTAGAGQVSHGAPTAARARFWAALLVATAVVSAAADPAVAQAEPVSRKLLVGTKEAAPFSFKNPDGSWGGISIDLWRKIASELELEYSFREMDLKSLVEGLESGSIDVAVAALTVTEEREEAFDFSHPFYSAGLGIAVQTRGGATLLAVLRGIFSVEFAGIVGALVLVLLGVGVLIWILERRRNPEHFGGSLSEGVGAAVWWSAVTMTTVGYGDKAPRTGIGRLLAVIWMFAGILLISVFTAAVASTLTVGELISTVNGPQDLPDVRVATVTGTTSEEYLKKRGIRYRSFSDPQAGLDALASDAIDALVYDAPILRHLLVASEEISLRVLPTMFERQDYAIGLGEGSPLREPINRVLLRETTDPSWEGVLEGYLGK